MILTTKIDDMSLYQKLATKAFGGCLESYYEIFTLPSKVYNGDEIILESTLDKCRNYVISLENSVNCGNF